MTNSTDLRVVEGMSNQAYHDCKEYLSSSMLKEFVKPGGPEKVHKKLVKGPSEETTRMGTLAHAWNLEGLPPISVEDPDYKTLNSVKFKKHAIEEYGLPEDITADDLAAFVEYNRLATVDEYAALEAMHEVFTASSKVKELMGKGRAEVSIFWTDPVTGVRLRARPDWLPDRGGMILDYKTSRDASPEKFARAVFDLSYHVQAALYLRAARAAGWDKTRFVFIVQEKEPPYSLAFYELSEEWLREGEFLVGNGLEEYAYCQKTGDWYGYAQDIQVLEPKPWWLS